MKVLSRIKQKCFHYTWGSDARHEIIYRGRYFIGKRYEEEKKQGERTDLTSGQSDQKSISEIIVEETGISDSTVRRNANYSKAIDEIKKH